MKIINIPEKNDCCALILLLMLIMKSIPGDVHAGLSWDRIQLSSKLSVQGEYSDNVFLSHVDVRDDHIISIEPEFRLNFALAPRNILSLEYDGEYQKYQEFDNFRQYQQQGLLSWSWTAPKGSQLGAGTSVQDRAIQPFSEQDQHQDFITWETFGNVNIAVGNHTQTGLKYNRTSRRFEDERNELDDFDRDAIAVELIYSRFRKIPLLFEYRYAHQDNLDRSSLSTDSDTHAVMFGFRWAPTAKLSGALRLGYSQTDFKAVDDFDGIVTDTDLTYAYSGITTFKLVAKRDVVTSTLAARETGESFISTGFELSAIHHKWEPLIVTLRFGYTNNSFRDLASTGENRTDEHFQAAVEIQYFIRKWLACNFTYQYHRNDSNLPTVDYNENRFLLGLSIPLKTPKSRIP